MNVLLECSTYNYRSYYNLAVNIKKKFPDAVFSVLLGSIDRNADKLFATSDIEFSIYDARKTTDYDVDYELDELLEIENSIMNGKMWYYISADKVLGSKYMTGDVSKIKTNDELKYKEILSNIVSQVRFYKKVFTEQSPDLFIPAIAMGGVGVFILEKMCSLHGTLYLYPSLTRIGSRIAFSDNVLLSFPYMDKYYSSLRAQDTAHDFKEAEKLYREIRNKITSYVDIKDKEPIDSYSGLVRHTLKFLYYSMWEVYRAIRTKHGFTRALFKNIKFQYAYFRQKLIVYGGSYGDKLSRDQKYIYYPLQTIPEYATNIQATGWMNQLYNIELLSKSIPADWVVYVKEHPSQFIGRCRDLNFYNEIEKYPNVFIAPFSSDAGTLISNAQMVAVLTGTTGWEAICRGVPVISFVNNYWDVLDLSKVCKRPDDLGKDIKKEFERFHLIPYEERKMRIITYLASSLQYSFNISHFDVFHYYRVGTDMEHARLGDELFDGLVKYLEMVYIDENIK